MKRRLNHVNVVECERDCLPHIEPDVQNQAESIEYHLDFLPGVVAVPSVLLLHLTDRQILHAALHRFEQPQSLLYLHINSIYRVYKLPLFKFLINFRINWIIAFLLYFDI